MQVTQDIRVLVSAQTLLLRREGKTIRSYAVSTSRFGVGNEEGSYKTPPGRHRVAGKAGAGAPAGTVFRERARTGEVVLPGPSSPLSSGDAITSRILRLEGLEPGVNRGEGIDSLARCIYIHGTPEESRIGIPASHGCIRMRNADVIELFDLVETGTEVVIEA